MKQIIVIVFLLSGIFVFAQNDSVISDKINSKLKVSEVNVFTGRLFFDGSNEDYNSFQSIALKGSDIKDFSGWEESNSFGDIYSYGINIALSPYLEENDAYNHCRKLIFGLNFKSGDRRLYKFSNETHTSYGALQDTNVSNVQLYSRDTTIRNSYIFREGTQEITINSAYFLYTDPRRIISFNTGVGINLGFSLNSSIIQGFSTDTLLSIDDSDKGRYYFENDKNPTWDYQYNESNGSLFLRAYIPIGINLRLSKESEVLNQLTLYAQGLIGYELQYIYGTDSYSRIYWGTEVGIRHFF